MARYNDFDAAEAERSGDPITFRLGGREWTVAHINAGGFLTFARQQAKGGIEVVLGFDDYITNALKADQRDDFHAMLEAADIQLSTLIAVATWIVEQATGNPTAAASPSPPPPSKNGRPARVVSLDGLSTQQSSASDAG